jgi:hypothetical protein
METKIEQKKITSSLGELEQIVDEIEGKLFVDKDKIKPQQGELPVPTAMRLSQISSAIGSLTTRLNRISVELNILN